MKTFNDLMPSTVDARIIFQEVDAGRQDSYDCVYTLSHDDIAELLQTIKGTQESLEDLHNNPNNKEELNKRLNTKVFSV